MSRLMDQRTFIFFCFMTVFAVVAGVGITVIDMYLIDISLGYMIVICLIGGWLFSEFYHQKFIRRR